MRKIFWDGFAFAKSMENAVKFVAVKTLGGEWHVVPTASQNDLIVNDLIYESDFRRVFTFAILCV